MIKKYSSKFCRTDQNENNEFSKIMKSWVLKNMGNDINSSKYKSTNSLHY